MALTSLKFKHQRGDHDENRAGVPTYDGNPSGFHNWEFRTLMKAKATEVGKGAQQIEKVIGALRGDALQCAMDIGISLHGAVFRNSSMSYVF